MMQAKIEERVDSKEGISLKNQSGCVKMLMNCNDNNNIKVGIGAFLALSQ